MRRILVVGAGQSGLQLALGLQRHGYDVTVMSARTADEIEHGHVMSTQFQFGTAMSIERELGLNFWDDAAPRVPYVHFAVGGEDAPVIDWVGRWGEGIDVDQRVKMSRWLRLFEERGGNVVIHSVTVSDLDRLAGMYDLVIVAAGKGDLVGMFDRDPSRSPYVAPQRALSVVYVNGFETHPDRPGDHAVELTMLPGMGELIVMPALTVTGPCHILFFEAIPGGPLDVFGEVRTPREHLERFVEVLERHLPWLRDRYDKLELTDVGGTLRGGFTPVVRLPIGRLPSGGQVFGIADVVVVNDPVTGQGSNNAAKCAAVYLDSVLAQGDAPFDTAFMQRTFDTYWTTYARAVTEWTNALLAPPPPHVLELLGAAGRFPAIADRFARGFDDPNDYFEWFMDPDRAAAYLAEVAADAAS
jgi:hypothetical protein